MKRIRFLLPLLIFISLFFLHSPDLDISYAQEPVQPLSANPVASPISTEQYYRARVIEILRDETKVVAEVSQPTQVVRVLITSGDEEDKEVIIEYGGQVLIDVGQKLKVGDLIVVNKLTTTEGTSYYIADRYRLPPLGIIAGIFFFLAIIFARVKGLTSIIGMVVSILILVRFLIPGILAGHDPFIVSLVSAFMIAVLSLYLAHGLSKRTTIALVSTLITLGLSAAIALLFVSLAKLTGTGSEEALFLQLGANQAINLRGLLLGGIMIGALGVLDDITTAQVAAIEEIYKANSLYTFKELYQKGLSVGREHIASLVNTLVLAYAGASLPLFLLFYRNANEPLWVTLNTEHIVEEVIRTLVGSTGLILAVPITTVLAAWFFVDHKKTKSKIKVT